MRSRYEVLGYQFTQVVYVSNIIQCTCMSWEHVDGWFPEMLTCAFFHSWSFFRCKNNTVNELLTCSCGFVIGGVVSSIDLLAIHFTPCYYSLRIFWYFTSGHWSVAEATPLDAWNTFWTSWLPLSSCLSHPLLTWYHTDWGQWTQTSALPSLWGTCMNDCNQIWSLVPASTVVCLFFTVPCWWGTDD